MYIGIIYSHTGKVINVSTHTISDNFTIPNIASNRLDGAGGTVFFDPLKCSHKLSFIYF